MGRNMSECENHAPSGAKVTCDDLYDCCDCGGSECGCAYCWSCNACSVCNGEDE